MSRALLVIDAQQSFTQRPFWDAAHAAGYLARQQQVIDAARAQGVPVLQVFHTSDDEGPDGAFARESGHVRTLEGLRIAPDAVFHKQVHSSLFARDAAGHALPDWLDGHGVTEVLITGIRTEQCCETTARHASDSGLAVRFVSDATLTFPMRHADGRWFSAEDIQARTELVLAGRFARIVRADTALAD